MDGLDEGRSLARLLAELGVEFVGRREIRTPAAELERVNCIGLFRCKKRRHVRSRRGRCGKKTDQGVSDRLAFAFASCDLARLTCSLVPCAKANGTARHSV